MLKKLFDVFASLLCLIFLFPVFVFLGIAIGLKLGFPIFFTQLRPGKNGKIFKLIKFRSMSYKQKSDGSLLPDGDRISGFGRFLRSSSLDELPELINVLKGEMSIVGPRPLLVEYLPLYSQFENRRHEVLPGITGWAQVNGRNTISWSDKFDLDVWCVDNCNLFLDFKIIFLTFFRVLSRSNIDDSTGVGQERFKGSQKGNQ